MPSSLPGSPNSSRKIEVDEFIKKLKDRSVTVSGGNVGIISTGENAKIRVGSINYAGAADGDDDAKAKLKELIAKLNETLANVPEENKADAEAVATMTEDLMQKASAEKPNKTLVRISANGLKEAADALAGVVPAAIRIVKEIIALIAGPVA